MTLRWLTAGESHGPGLTGIIDGLPAGLPLDAARIDHELWRRQQGVGRGGRMQIEHDTIAITGGVRLGQTLGGPVSLWLANRDWANWQDRMRVTSPGEGEAWPDPVTLVRPGHIDLAGSLKLGHSDVRNTLERASARETAMRVSLGTCARLLLEAFGIAITSRVLSYGALTLPYSQTLPTSRDGEISLAELLAEGADRLTEYQEAIANEASLARTAGTSLGGSLQTIAYGVPPGLGHVGQWDRRLDGLIAQHLMSIHTVKAVAIGAGTDLAGMTGQESNDALYVRTIEEQQPGGPWWIRRTNHMGGIEGGVTNGEPVIATLHLKPLSTQSAALPSIDIATGEPADALRERTDVAVIEAAAVVAEAMLAIALASALIDKFGGDVLSDMQAAHAAYLVRIYRHPVNH